MARMACMVEMENIHTILTHHNILRQSNEPWSWKYNINIVSEEQHMRILNGIDSGQGLLKTFCEDSDDSPSYTKTKIISSFAQQPSIQD
jgi:hypothetical protein